MNISYIDFWPGFNPNSNWFNQVFKDLLNDKEINFTAQPEEADVIISATFGNQKELYRNSKAIKIFYTGENVKPDLYNCDFSLSFDYNSYSGRNLRLPHWFLYIDWWGTSSPPVAEISIKDISNNLDPEELWERKDFCSIVIGNPVPNRLEVVSELSKYKPVHGFGSVFNNRLNGSKIELLKDYKFNICFENTIAPRYITEKLLEAKVAGCMPLYFGDSSVSLDFNERAFINYNDFSRLDYFIEAVKILDTNKDVFISLSKEKLFKTPPSLDDLYSFLRRILS